MSETTPRDYLSRMAIWFALWVGVLMACVAFVNCARGADDKGQNDRDRKARAALALAGSQGVQSVAVAPAPRQVTAKLSYPAGHKAATLEQTPLVVFVGMDGTKPTGAIVSRADQLGDVNPPAVVVAYPVGDRLYIDAAIPESEASAERIQKAVDAAAKKLDGPPRKDMPPPAPKPLDWQIRNTPALGAVLMVALVADLPPTAKPVCICGDRCECEARGRTCPGQCPVVVTPPGFGPAPAGLEWWRDPRGPGGWGLRQVGVTDATRNVASPVAVGFKTPVFGPSTATIPTISQGIAPASSSPQNCPNGRCPNPVQGGVILRPANPFGR